MVEVGVMGFLKLDECPLYSRERGLSTPTPEVFQSPFKHKICLSTNKGSTKSFWCSITCLMGL